MSQESYDQVFSDARSAYLDDPASWTKSERLFRNPDEQLEWMDANNKVAYKPDLLVKHKRFDEAASFARELGKSIDASVLQLRSKTKMSKTRALGYLLEALSLKAPLGTPIEVLKPEEKKTVDELVSSAKLILSRADYEEKEEVRLEKQHLIEVFEATASRNRQDLNSATSNLLAFAPSVPALFAIEKYLQLASSGRFSLSEGQEIWDLSHTFAFDCLPFLQNPEYYDTNAPFLGLFQQKDPKVFKASPRSRLREDPLSTKSLTGPELTDQVHSLAFNLRQERRIFALQHFRVSTSFMGTTASSFIDLPAKASFRSLALKLNIVSHEMSFETAVKEEARDEQTGMNLLHGTEYWLQVLSKLLLPQSLKDGSRSNAVVDFISAGLPFIVSRLLSTAIDDLDPSAMGPSKLIERTIVIVNLLDILLPTELKQLVVASSFPQEPSLGKHRLLQSFEGNTIQLLTSHFGILRFGHGALEEFVYSGLILLEIQMQAATAIPLLLEMVERTIVLLVVGVRRKESRSWNGLTAPLSYLRKITESTLLFSKPPSTILLQRARSSLSGLIDGMSDLADSPDLLKRAISLAVFFAELDVDGREDLVKQCRELDAAGHQNRFTRAYTWPELVQASIEIQPNSLDPVFTLIDSTHASCPTMILAGFKPTAISPLQIHFTSFDDLSTSLLSLATSDEALETAFKSRKPGSASVAKNGPWDPNPFRWLTPTPGSKEAEDPVYELSKPLEFPQEMLDRTLSGKSTKEEPSVVPAAKSGKEEIKEEIPWPGEKKVDEVAVKEVPKGGEEVEVYLSGNSWRMGWGNGLVERGG